MFRDSMEPITGDGTTHQPRESMSIKDLEATNPPAKTPGANEIRSEGEKELATPGKQEKPKQTYKLGRVTKELATSVLGQQPQ